MRPTATTALTGGSTPHQRLYVRTLMRDLGLATGRFTYQHRTPFKSAGLPEPVFDADIDAHLCALSRKQASALIDALKRQAGDDEEDDG